MYGPVEVLFGGVDGGENQEMSYGLVTWLGCSVGGW